MYCNSGINPINQIWQIALNAGLAANAKAVAVAAVSANIAAHQHECCHQGQNARRSRLRAREHPSARHHAELNLHGRNRRSLTRVSAPAHVPVQRNGQLVRDQIQGRGQKRSRLVLRPGFTLALVLQLAKDVRHHRGPRDNDMLQLIDWRALQEPSCLTVLGQSASGNFGAQDDCGQDQRARERGTLIGPPDCVRRLLMGERRARPKLRGRAFDEGCGHG